jgi:hypothetical protein
MANIQQVLALNIALKLVGFEVLTGVVMKSDVFYNITPCKSV